MEDALLKELTNTQGQNRALPSDEVLPSLSTQRREPLDREACDLAVGKRKRALLGGRGKNKRFASIVFQPDFGLKSIGTGDCTNLQDAKKATNISQVPLQLQLPRIKAIRSNNPSECAIGHILIRQESPQPIIHTARLHHAGHGQKQKLNGAKQCMTFDQMCSPFVFAKADLLKKFIEPKTMKGSSRNAGVLTTMPTCTCSSKC